ADVFLRGLGPLLLGGAQLGATLADLLGCRGGGLSDLVHRLMGAAAQPVDASRGLVHRLMGSAAQPVNATRCLVRQFSLGRLECGLHVSLLGFAMARRSARSPTG